ncbi:MAG: hypothetical protein HGA50_13980 [Deltaproteobacteria bacterium]|nr:hypothetical protein [Deltaproteobacteria bacterium]
MISKEILLLPGLLLVLILTPLKAQDIDSLLEEATGSATEYTMATFKSTRILNGHSIERMQNGQLDVRIGHRFGEVNTGAYDLWGLDQSANIFLGFEYGITDWVMVGISRSKYDKIFNGFLKFSVLRQSKGERNMPVSFSVLTSAAYSTLKWDKEGSLNEWDRMSYVTQLLVARKFNERFSLEINPTYIHRNMVATELDPNDLFHWDLMGCLLAGSLFFLIRRPFPKEADWDAFLKAAGPLARAAPAFGTPFAPSFQCVEVPTLVDDIEAHGENPKETLIQSGILPVEMNGFINMGLEVIYGSGDLNALKGRREGCAKGKCCSTEGYGCL